MLNLPSTPSFVAADTHASALARYWYYFALAAVCIFGYLYPDVGRQMRDFHVTPYLVVVAFLLNGFSLSTGSLLGSFPQWRILVLVVLMTFVVSPALIFGIRALFPDWGPDMLAEGFQLMALVPTMLVSSVVLTRTAHGDGALALYLTVVTNILAVAAIPLLMLFTLGTYFDSSVAPRFLLQTVMQLFLLVLAPLFAGQVLRRGMKRFADHAVGTVNFLSQCIILLFLLSGMSALPRTEITSKIWTLIVLGALGFHLLLLAIGYFSGVLLRIERPSRRALMFTGASKSMVLLILLWEYVFAQKGEAYGIMVLPGIVYYLISLILDSVLAQWLSDKFEARDRASQDIPC